MNKIMNERGKRVPDVLYTVKSFYTGDRIPESVPTDKSFEGGASHMGLRPARGDGYERQLTSRVIRECPIEGKRRS